MRVIVKLNHPAHYHLFKNLIKKLRENNAHVIIVIKNKDILKELLEINNENYISLLEPQTRKSGSIFSIVKANFIEIIHQDIKLYKLVKKIRPNIMMGTDTAIAHIGWLLNITTYIFNEDDYKINKLFCSFTYPFAKYIVSPAVCNVGKYKKKKIEYEGYQKLAYLHPNVFTPNLEILKRYSELNEKFFLVRLVSFSAGHDIEKKHVGLSKKLLVELIEILQKKGQVFISSEKKMDSEFEKFRLKINFNDIHHIMAFSELFISDSQSMTLEAAMLGVPSIRFNSFVGKISVLNEIEKKYNLSIGIDSNNPSELIDTVRNLLDNSNLKNEFKEKRDYMLSEKNGFTEFIYKYIKQK